MNEEANGFADALEEGMQRAKEQDNKSLISALSHCTAILDLPPEMVLQLLKIKPNDLWKLQNVLSLVKDSALNLSKEDMEGILDMARVVRIMEEEPDPRNSMSVGVTGPVGPIGSLGATGRTGPQTITVSSARDHAIEEFRLAATAANTVKKTVFPKEQRYRGGIRGPQSPRRC